MGSLQYPGVYSTGFLLTTTVSPISQCSLGHKPRGFLCSRLEGHCSCNSSPVSPTTSSGRTGHLRDGLRKTEFRKMQALAFSLSEIQVTSLLDEVPVDLWCSHINVWSINRFINRKQFLLGHPHLICFGFQFHLNA